MCTAHLHYYGAVIGLKSHQFACCDLIVPTSGGDTPEIWKENREPRKWGSGMVAEGTQRASARAPLAV